jgi:RimJ/RimL family protein N-acetyltransferase
MMSIEPITLEGARVRLAPLSLYHHARLCEIGLDEQLWRSTTIRLQTSDDMFNYIQTALQSQAEGNALPFVIIEKDSDRVVGTTRYHSINQEHRRLEIGFTWIALRWQRTLVNTETKYLMLKHAFEHYRCVRVEFKADSGNEQSSRALIRIGAKQEGVLRKYMTSGHKGARDLILFSIIDTEWPEVKANLEGRLNQSGKPS